VSEVSLSTRGAATKLTDGSCTGSSGFFLSQQLDRALFFSDAWSASCKARPGAELRQVAQDHAEPASGAHLRVRATAGPTNGPVRINAGPHVAPYLSPTIWIACLDGTAFATRRKEISIAGDLSHVQPAQDRID
jgi:hypothetical protein